MCRPVVSLLTIVVLVSTACGAVRPTLENTDGLAREATATSAAVPTSTSVDAHAAKLVIRLAVPGTWSGDPADAGPASISNRVLADLLFEGLTTLDASGAPVPGLAESWTTSADRLAWTFVLPDGLVDGQGVSVRSVDVAESLDRVARRGPTDQVATALTAVSGWQETMNGDVNSVSGIEVVDDLSLRIRLDHTFELLPTILAAPGLGVLVSHSDGTTGTTGEFRPTSDANVLEPVSTSSSVGGIELVPDNGNVATLVATGQVDWAVVPPGTSLGVVPGDLIRAPLDLRVGFEVRLADRAARVGVIDLIDSVAVAAKVPGLSAVVMPPVAGLSIRPSDVVIDAPNGRLAEVSRSLAASLEAAGVTVGIRVSAPSEFARRVASGEATIFPITIAGGTGVGGSTMRFFSPGGIDNWTGFDSEHSASLAEQAMSEIDPTARAAAFPAIERDLAQSGYVIVVGQWEVNLAIGGRISGMRQRVDGTLDVSGAVLADAAVDNG